MKKLSKPQQEVIDLMKQGWELYYTSGIRGAGWACIQQGGMGRGGESKHVNIKTLHYLEDCGLIKINKETWRDRTYKLTY